MRLYYLLPVENEHNFWWITRADKCGICTVFFLIASLSYTSECVYALFVYTAYHILMWLLPLSCYPWATWGWLLLHFVGDQWGRCVCAEVDFYHSQREYIAYSVSMPFQRLCSTLLPMSWTESTRCMYQLLLLHVLDGADTVYVSSSMNPSS